MTETRWPIHPQPQCEQSLYEWVFCLSEIYGVDSLFFYECVLQLTLDEVYNLRTTLPHKALKILSQGTGVHTDELRKRDVDKCFQFCKFRLVRLSSDKDELCCIRSTSSEKVIAVCDLTDNEYVRIFAHHLRQDMKFMHKLPFWEENADENYPFLWSRTF